MILISSLLRTLEILDLIFPNQDFHYEWEISSIINNYYCSQKYKYYRNCNLLQLILMMKPLYQSHIDDILLNLKFKYSFFFVFTLIVNLKLLISNENL